MWFIDVFQHQIYFSFCCLKAGQIDGSSKQQEQAGFVSDLKIFYRHMFCRYSILWNYFQFNFCYEILELRYPVFNFIWNIQNKFSKGFCTWSYLDQDDLFKNHHKNWLAEHGVKSKAPVWHFDEILKCGSPSFNKICSIFSYIFAIVPSKKRPNIKVQYVIVVLLQIF